MTRALPDPQPDRGTGPSCPRAAAAVMLAALAAAAAVPLGAGAAIPVPADASSGAGGGNESTGGDVAYDSDFEYDTDPTARGWLGIGNPDARLSVAGSDLTATGASEGASGGLDARFTRRIDLDATEPFRVRLGGLDNDERAAGTGVFLSTAEEAADARPANSTGYEVELRQRRDGPVTVSRVDESGTATALRLVEDHGGADVDVLLRRAAGAGTISVLYNGTRAGTLDADRFDRFRYLTVTFDGEGQAIDRIAVSGTSVAANGTLAVNRTRLSPNGTIRFTVTATRGPVTLFSDPPYRIQRLTGGRWMDVGPEVTLPVVFTIENGSSRSWTWPQRAFRPDAGEYRVVLGAESATYRTRFTVTEPGAGPPRVCPGGDPPTDPDGDGVYEDVDGDGTVDVFDVQCLLERFDTPSVQENPAAFDFDGGPGVDVFDVQALLGEL